MPISPFLATVLINQGGTSITDLIFTTVTKIATFTTKHKDNNAFPSSNTHARAIVNCPWSSTNAEFASINAAPSIEPIILSHSVKLYEAFIQVPAPANPVPGVNNASVLN